MDHRQPRPAVNDLEALIARAKYLLLDFDGPVCQVYAGLPQPGVSSGASHALRYSCKALTNGRHSCGTAHGLYLWAQRQARAGLRAAKSLICGRNIRRYGRWELGRSLGSRAATVRLSQLQLSVPMYRARTAPVRRSPRSIRPLRSSRRCSRVSDVDRRSQVP